jgi:hypothetical protein
MHGSGAPSRRSAWDIRYALGAVVISAAVKWPTSAPRSPRCRPHSDIKFTSAICGAGTTSR